MMTRKANSLPEDLRVHWEDAMAEKFPMNIEEAGAYIQSRYGDKCSVSFMDGAISVNIVLTGDIVEGQNPPSGASVQWYDSPAYLGKRGEWRKYEYIQITDFKKSSIDKKLKEYYQNN